MARGSKIVLNRKAFDAIALGLADGVFDTAVQILHAAEALAPDPPPIGERLVSNGGAVAWIGTKKIADTTIGGRAIAKPKRLALDSQVTAVVGFGFPARFVELGTVRAHAHPFLTPAVDQVLPGADILISDAMARRLRGEAAPNSAGINARIRAAKAARRERIAAQPTMGSLMNVLRAEAKRQGYGR